MTRNYFTLKYVFPSLIHIYISPLSHPNLSLHSLEQMFGLMEYVALFSIDFNKKSTRLCKGFAKCDSLENINVLIFCDVTNTLFNTVGYNTIIDIHLAMPDIE